MNAPASPVKVTTARGPQNGESADSVISQSGLPPELMGLVTSVVRACRLWRAERADVARELCGHFLDGLDDEVSPEELATSFGEPRQAARLITASKRRLRGPLWKAWYVVSRSVAATLGLMVLVYAVLAARFFMATPNIARNYVAELNAPILSTPEKDRAWPGFVRAMREFGALPDFLENDPRHPGDADWASMVEFLDSHAGAMETVRAASRARILGYVHGTAPDPAYEEAMAISRPGYTPAPRAEVRDEAPLVVGMLLPYLSQMRSYAKWLAADAHLAASRGEPDRYTADVRASLDLARLCVNEKGLFISNLVGLAIANLTMRTVLEEAGTQGFLRNEQLRDLAHCIGSFAKGQVHLDISGEKIAVEDILQRYFSDDGAGDGRYIASNEDEKLLEDLGAVRPKGYVLLRAIQPVQSTLLPSRAEFSAMADRFVSEFAHDDLLPPWRRHEGTSDSAYMMFMQRGLYSVSPALRVLADASWSPSGVFGPALAQRDEFEAYRGAALAVLAIEMSRQMNGKYPASLDELVPGLLPALPLDPFDGKPLRYVPQMEEGARPILYSVGADKADDHGRGPDSPEGRSRAALIGVQKLTLVRADGTTSVTPLPLPDNARGDWVIWPVVVDAAASPQNDAKSD